MIGFRRGVAMVAGGVAVVLAVAVPATVAEAHPLGNFTVNQFTGLRVDDQGVSLDLVTDEAEIPAFQARAAIDVNHDGELDATETGGWRSARCADAVGTSSVRLDGRSLDLSVVTESSALTFPTGQAGLLTLRLECRLRAAVAFGTDRHTIVYRNTAFTDRIGWHEIVTQPSGAVIDASDVSATSVTSRLTSYPTAQLRSPLDQRAATITFHLGSGAVLAPIEAPKATPNAVTALLPRGADRATRAFTSLVARRNLTVAFALVAFGVALLLGALHALAPGHGKTVMAAYLVGQRGSLRQAGLIGLTVTATHTAGVLALGIILTTSNALAAERLYPWLGVASGLLLASIGFTLTRRAWGARRRLADAVDTPHGAHDHGHDHLHDDDHDHGHDHDHDHGHGHGHGHDHDHALVGARAISETHAHGGWTHSHPTLDPEIGWRSLVAVGFAGGLVPSPSALLVLVGAIALGRTWFGLVLILAYGIGMATMLTSAGLLLVRAHRLFERRALGGRRSPRLAFVGRFLPLVTSLAIIAIGLSLAARSAGRI